MTTVNSATEIRSRRADADGAFIHASSREPLLAQRLAPQRLPIAARAFTVDGFERKKFADQHVRAVVHDQTAQPLFNKRAVADRAERFL